MFGGSDESEGVIGLRSGPPELYALLRLLLVKPFL